MRQNTRRLWRRLIAMAIGTLILMMFSTHFTIAQDATPVPTEVPQTTTTEASTTTEAAAEPTTEAPAAESAQVSIDAAFVFITACLVFFMQAGFAFLEAGMLRQTGVVNSMIENFMDAAFGGIAFFITGFALAFGADNGSGLFGTTNFFLSEALHFTNGTVVYGGEGISIFILFFFQFAFAATAGTIATGAMAERTNFVGKIIYSIFIAAFSYPIVIHWVWGGGWLAQRGFLDFAGSTAVHLAGGMLALVGAIILGPRIGRVWGSPPKPHNLPFAALGTMILWLGWYGFNPGSALSISNNGFVGLVTVNTTLAACVGAFVAVLFVYSRTGKWDLPAALNGCLAGLVAITAGCAFVAPWASLVIGGIAGILVILSADLFEKIKIDDPAGAFHVHGTCGIFGTLAIGFLGQPELGANGLLLGGGIDQLINQIIGVVAVIVWMGGTSLVLFFILRALNILRISNHGETMGIDAYEHGASAYPDIVPVPSGSGD
ncbi:MAG: ammonium transporter [Anaerolineaceae bacterium]|nr:ammonium transporter [Anaerolineaceae bacterium]